MNEPSFGEIVIGMMILCIVLIIVFTTILLGRMALDDEYLKKITCSCEIINKE